MPFMTSPDIAQPAEQEVIPFDDVEELQEPDDLSLELEELELEESDDLSESPEGVGPSRKSTQHNLLARRKLDSTLPDGYQLDPDIVRLVGANAHMHISQDKFSGKKDSSAIDYAEEESVNDFSRLVRQFPLLNKQLEEIIFNHRNNGGTVSDLRRDPNFWEAFGNVEPEKIQLLLDSSSSIRDLVVNANMRLVFKVASRYKRRLPMSDMVAEGAVGMQKAVDKFEIERGNKFSTYATWWIRQAITRAIIDQGSSIRIPVHAAELATTIRNLIDDFSKREGREPEFHEIVAITAKNGYEKRAAVNVINAALHGTLGEPASLNTPVGDNEDTTIGDYVEDTVAEENIISAVFNAEDSQVIKDALATLTPREKMVLELRFGLNGGNGMTLEEVGREFGVTRERIRQIEVKGLRKLRLNRGLLRGRRVSDEVVDEAVRQVVDSKGQEKDAAIRTVSAPRRLEVNKETSVAERTLY